MSQIARTIDQLIEPVGKRMTAEVAERLVALRADSELRREVDRTGDRANAVLWGKTNSLSTSNS